MFTNQAASFVVVFSIYVHYTRAFRLVTFLQAHVQIVSRWTLSYTRIKNEGTSIATTAFQVCHNLQQHTAYSPAAAFHMH
jgi:hypothetical protein